jgi:hypothetical protein
MPISFFQHAHTAEGIKIAEKRAEIILNFAQATVEYLCTNRASLLTSITPRNGGSQKKLFEVVQKTERPCRIKLRNREVYSKLIIAESNN